MNIESFKNSIGGGVRTALFRVGGRIGSRTDELLFSCHRSFPSTIKSTNHSTIPWKKM